MLKKYSLRLIRHLIDFNENMEFYLRHALRIAIDGEDWLERYAGIIVIKMYCENKKDFFIENKNYCRKVIECLVFGYKTSSESVKRESVDTLTKFIAKLPNYAEVTRLLPNELLGRIYQMQCEAQSEIETQIDKLIDKSITILSNPLIKAPPDENDINKINIEEEEEKIIKPQKVYVDSSGNVYGIFPSELVASLSDKGIDLETKISNCKKIFDIFMQHKGESAFMRFANSFFKFLSLYITHSSISISSLCLTMMDEMIKSISGVNLIASLHSCLPIIISTLKNSNISIRRLTNEILYKIIMILPTSQVIPYVINAISTSHDIWILLVECLAFMEYIFSHLNEIYNDIEWKGEFANYDLNILFEILKLFDHPIVKVVISARKVIKYFGVNIEQKDDFLKKIVSYVNDPLYNEIHALLYNEKVSYKGKQVFDVATQRVISALNPKMSMSIAAKKNEEILLFSKVKKYNNMKKDDEVKLNTDEHLMESLLDSQGRIIKTTRPPEDNYPNYQIDKPEEKKERAKSKIERKTMRSKLKRYNDPTEVQYNEIYDKSYSFVVHDRKELSPLKLNKNFKAVDVYFSLLAQMKNKLNWEKQFKAVDSLRKLIQYNKGTLRLNEHYLNDIINALLDMSCSIRSLLAKNSLVCLSELFEVDGINIQNSYEDLCRILFKKMQDKNGAIKEEAIRTMISLIMFGRVEELSTVFLKDYTQSRSPEVICIVVMCFGFFLKYHKRKIFNLANWNKMMVYVTEMFDAKRKNQKIRDAAIDFYKILREFFNNEAKFQEYLKSYFAIQTFETLLFFMEKD